MEKTAKQIQEKVTQVEAEARKISAQQVPTLAKEIITEVPEKPKPHDTREQLGSVEDKKSEEMLKGVEKSSTVQSKTTESGSMVDVGGKTS